MLRDARRIERAADVLDVERWASQWLGRAWLAAPFTEREPEQTLCSEVARRASARPAPHGLAAVLALRRVAAESAHQALDDAVESLTESQPRPQWSAAEPWTPVKAWRAVDVWETERLLFVDIDGSRPHTLAAVADDVEHRMQTLVLMQMGAAPRWLGERADDMPLSLTERPVADVLAELSDMLRKTDMTIPKQDDEDFVELRSLAWSRSGAYLPGWEDSTDATLSEAERQHLIDAFTGDSGLRTDDVTRSLAELFLDHGEGYFPHALAWSPDRVGIFLADYLPRKAVLDEDDRAGLPEALRRWVRFALARRGVEDRWITPVVDAVDEYLPEFEAAFDDEAAWGPAKQVAAALEERGVDLSDQEAVEQAVREVNAERLARRLLENGTQHDHGRGAGGQD